ncbi:MAG: phage capsid protein [Actinomycetota bacterium]|nr:phage capsid protein [Actinomycetota bacterium]
MSTTIDTAFVRQYERDVHHVFQRAGGQLKQTVRFKGGVVGSSTTFQKIGTGTATTKARHAVITPMNQDHTAIQCTLADFYAGDWVDKLDEAKTNVDERMAIATGGARALGRKIDDQIMTALDATTETAVTWTVTSENAIRNSILLMSEALDDNDVPNDGQRYGIVTPRVWAYMSTVEEFANSQYIGANGLPLMEGAPIGRWKYFNGVLWTVNTGLPGKGGNAGKVFAYHRDAVGYASGADVSADITWHGDRAAHFVNHMMSGGSCLIDTTGVIEGVVDDNESLPTS